MPIAEKNKLDIMNILMVITLNLMSKKHYLLFLSCLLTLARARVLLYMAVTEGLHMCNNRRGV